jgi:molybdopterin/thiamine biosynthesis adenylyltransferase
LFKYDNRIFIGTNNRLFSKYIKSKEKKITYLNFLFLDLDDLPSAFNEVSANDFFKCLSEKSKILLKKYNAKSNNQYFLLNYKNKDIYNYILLEFTGCRSQANNLFLDENASLSIYSVRNVSTNFLRFRGGSDIFEDNILVVGCGSVGSELLDILASTGYNNLTIVDNDQMNYENTYRFSTGFFYLNNFQPKFKTDILKFELENKYPDVTITNYNADIIDLIENNLINLSDYKYIVCTTGNNILYKYINKYIYENEIKIKVIFAWLEPYGVAEHVLSINTENKGCYECYEKSSSAVNIASLNNSYKIRNNVCSGSFTPYGKLSTISLACKITEILLNDSKRIELLKNKHNCKKGNCETFVNFGYQTTKYFNYSQEEIDNIVTTEGMNLCVSTDFIKIESHSECRDEILPDFYKLLISKCRKENWSANRRIVLWKRLSVDIDTTMPDASWDLDFENTHKMGGYVFHQNLKIEVHLIFIIKLVL